MELRNIVVYNMWFLPDRIQGMIQQRMLNFWQQPDFVFRLLGYSRKQEQLLATLHAFTRDIIARRRQMYLAQRNHTGAGNADQATHCQAGTVGR